MSGFLELFSQYDVLGAFLVNIELTLWSALFSLILGVILVVMRISPISSLRAVAGAYVELFSRHLIHARNFIANTANRAH